MKIFMTFSALILCFVIHGVLTGRLIPSSRIVLDKCFQNFYSNNCSEDFEKVISTVSNKWCCIKFIYNEKDDDEALQNNVMTSSGNGNENMTTNITISREAYDDSTTTDDVSTDTKLDDVEKNQNSMLDETDSINMNEAIDDSSLSLIENSIDSQLNGAADDDNAESLLQTVENFENIESNLNANEIENELSDTRMDNENEFETFSENESEIEDLNGEELEDASTEESEEENSESFEEEALEFSNEDPKDEISATEPIDYENLEDKYSLTEGSGVNRKMFDEYPEEFEEITEFDQEELDQNLEEEIPEYSDESAAESEYTEEFEDNIEVAEETDKSTEAEEELNDNDLEVLESDQLSEDLEEDLSPLNGKSIDTIESLQESNTDEPEDDFDKTNQLDETNEPSEGDDSIKMYKQINHFKSADLNHEDESSESEDSIDKNFTANEDENVIQFGEVQESNDENSIEFNNGIEGSDELKLEEELKSKVTKISLENSEKSEETSLDPSLDTEEESEIFKEAKKSLKNFNKFEKLQSAPSFSTKLPFAIPGSGKHSKFNMLNKIKSSQPSRNNKFPRKSKSFNKLFTNKLTQRSPSSRRMDSKKKPSKKVDRKFPFDSHDDLNGSNSGQLHEANENSRETHSSLNDDDSNEFQKRHDNGKLRRHEDVMNGNAREMNHDDAENENSLNNPKSSSESFSIESDLNNGDVEEENIKVKKSRQQQISKLSKQSPASDTNDSPQSDNLVENESNQVEDSLTEKVKNDNNELQFEDSADGKRQRVEENWQHEYNRVDDNNREYENDELENNQIGNEVNDNGGDEAATMGIRDEEDMKRRPGLINLNNFGVRVNEKDVLNLRKDDDDTRKSNIVETIENIGSQVVDTVV